MTPPQTTQWWRALGYAWQFGYTVAVPLVVFALVGKVLDRRFDTSPWLLLGGIVLAILTSSVLLVRTAFRILRDVQRETTPKQPHQKPPTEPPKPEDPFVL